MERRNFIAALLSVPALGLLAACGSDSTGDSLQTADTTAESPSDDTTPPVSEPPPAPTEPVEAQAPLTGDVVLSYTTPGGFTTREFAFQDPPIALLTSDGTLLTSGVTPAVFPGPLLPAHVAQSVSAAGVAAVLDAAESAGLLAEVDYASDDDLLIADASTATLMISSDGASYTHEAYALGIGGGPGGGAESTPERQALLDFLTTLQSDPAAIVGADNLGPATEFAPTAYQFVASPVDDLSVFDPAPTVVAWPADSGVELAAATECVEIERDAVGDLLDSATQLTFFSEGDATYQLTVRPAYPGRSC